MMWTMLIMQTATLGAANYAIDTPMEVPASVPSFADEFESNVIDDSKWRYDTDFNARGWFNNEMQYYADSRWQNSRVENGVLVVEAHHEDLAIQQLSDWGGQAYSSAKLVTRQSYGPGFYEIRAKLPCGRGTWPAIWMLPAKGKWPDMGEIDIMEMVGWDANVVHATLHTGAYNHAKGTQRGARIDIPTSCTKFHNYQLHWTENAITIGIDGKGYMRVANDQPGGDSAWPFTRPYHLILNLAIGGDWAGKEGIDDAALPQQMQIDYVRYWAAEDTE